VIDEGAAHGDDGQTDGLRLVLRFGAGLLCEAEEGFVDQGGGLEDVAGVLVPEERGGAETEFIVK